MKRFLYFLPILAIGLVCSLIIPTDARAQFVAAFEALTVESNGALRGPVNFFQANANRIFAVIGTSNLVANLAAKAGLTNAAMVTPTLTGANLAGTTVVPNGANISLASGSGLVATPGSVVVVDQIVIGGAVTNRTALYGATRGELDNQATSIVNDLAALRALPVATFLHRIVYVRNSTGNNGAAGAWIWDYGSTWTESVVIQKSDTLPTDFAGRWLHL